MRSTLLTATLLLATAVASNAQAQAQVEELMDGVTISTGIGTAPTRTEPVNSLDLSYLTGGTPVSGGYTLVSNAPIIQTLNGTTVSLSFIGSAGVYTGIQSLPQISGDSSTNYLMAKAGVIELNFSSAQNYLAMRWGTPSFPETLRFYNGDAFVMDVHGAVMEAILGVRPNNATVEFNFAELGFTRVVAHAQRNSVLEFDQVSFAAAPEPAPVPLGGIGGLVAFIVMMGARRRRVSWRNAAWEANPFPNILKAA